MPASSAGEWLALCSTRSMGMCAMREVLFPCARMPMPQHLPGLPTRKPTQALPLLPGVKQEQGGGV